MVRCLRMFLTWGIPTHRRTIMGIACIRLKHTTGELSSGDELASARFSSIATFKLHGVQVLVTTSRTNSCRTSQTRTIPGPTMFAAVRRKTVRWDTRDGAKRQMPGWNCCNGIQVDVSGEPTSSLCNDQLGAVLYCCELHYIKESALRLRPPHFSSMKIECSSK